MMDSNKFRSTLRICYHSLLSSQYMTSAVLVLQIFHTFFEFYHSANNIMQYVLTNRILKMLNIKLLLLIVIIEI